MTGLPPSHPVVPEYFLHQLKNDATFDRNMCRETCQDRKKYLDEGKIKLQLKPLWRYKLYHISTRVFLCNSL